MNDDGEGGRAGGRSGVGVGGGGGGGWRRAWALLPADGSKMGIPLCTRRRHAGASRAASNHVHIPSLQLRPSRCSHHSMSVASVEREPRARLPGSHELRTMRGCRDGSIRARVPNQGSLRRLTYSSMGWSPRRCSRTSSGIRWRRWVHRLTWHMRRTQRLWKVHRALRMCSSRARDSQPKSKIARIRASYTSALTRIGTSLAVRMGAARRLKAEVARPIRRASSGRSERVEHSIEPK